MSATLEPTKTPPPVCDCCHCRVCRAEAKAREEKRRGKVEPDYWILARRPLACLIFLFPLLVMYEVGAVWMGGDNPANVRNGADAWMRTGLETAGVPFGFLLPVLVVVILLTWHIRAKHPWSISSDTLMGMFAESLLFAFVLIVAGQVQNYAFEKFGNPEIPLSIKTAVPEPESSIGGRGTVEAVTYVGAGIYEEVLFRLLLLPCFYGVFRGLQLNTVWAAILAVLSTSVMFSVAHHIGPTGEPFRLFPFTFRFLAGLFFACLFVLRGFGIAVGTHAAYDLLVGIILCPPE